MYSKILVIFFSLTTPVSSSATGTTDDVYLSAETREGAEHLQEIVDHLSLEGVFEDGIEIRTTAELVGHLLMLGHIQFPQQCLDSSEDGTARDTCHREDANIFGVVVHVWNCCGAPVSDPCKTSIKGVCWADKCLE